VSDPQWLPYFVGCSNYDPSKCRTTILAADNAGFEIERDNSLDPALRCAQGIYKAAVEKERLEHKYMDTYRLVSYRFQATRLERESYQWPVCFFNIFPLIPLTVLLVYCAIAKNIKTVDESINKL